MHQLDHYELHQEQFFLGIIYRDSDKLDHVVNEIKNVALIKI